MSKEVSLSEFLSDDEVLERELSYSGNYKIGKEEPPSEYFIEKFRASHASLRCSGATLDSELVDHKHQMNWCNIDSYVRNWNKLSREDKLAVKALLHSDLTNNANRFGLKRKDLEVHLLLNIGCDMTNIVNNGKDSVRSNLLSMNGTYSSECLDNRAVDPKTCRRFANKFKKDYDVEKLFKSGFVAYQAVITMNSSVTLSDPLEAKEKIQLFFRENALMLSRLCHKKKMIPSYLRSHEISVSSITKGLYDPHTHLLFFVEKGTTDASLSLIEELFNLEFSDRKLEILRNDDLSFKCGKTFKSIEKSVDYLFNSYSLASQYLREAREDNLPALNKATVECYHNLIWLLRADSEHQGVQRFGKSHIPERNAEKTYKHPLLQKRRKSNTIKKVPLSQKKLRTFPAHEQPSTNRQTSSIRNAKTSRRKCSAGRALPRREGRHSESRCVGNVQKNAEISRNQESFSGSADSIHRQRAQEPRGLYESTQHSATAGSGSGTCRVAGTADAWLQILATETRDNSTSCTKRRTVSPGKREQQNCSESDSSQQSESNSIRKCSASHKHATGKSSCWQRTSCG